MSDANAPAGTGTPAAGDTILTHAPAATAQPAAPAAATTVTVSAGAAASPTAHGNEPIMSTEALNARLEQKARSTRNELLAELGVTDVAGAKAAIAEANARAAAAKTVEQKLAEAESQRESYKQQAETATALLADEVAAMLEELPADIQERVRAVGDSPLAQKAKIKELAALADSLGVDLFAEKPAAAPTNGTPQQPAKPPPANTAPPPTAPASGSHTDVDHKAVYAQLEKENPVRAAAYLSKHVRQIYPAQ